MSENDMACPECGERRMVTDTVLDDRGTRNEKMRLRLRCVNADCPSVESEMAPPTDGQF